MIMVGLSCAYPLTGFGLRHLLNETDGFTLSDAAAPHPDVIVHVCDRAEGDHAAVAESAVRAPVLVIADDPKPSTIQGYLAAGALGYLHIGAPLETVLHAVREVAQRCRFVRVPHRDPDLRDSAVSGLSAREKQVLERIANGLTHEQTARALGLSVHTVDTYVRRARRKLQAGNKADLIRVALVL
jgi:DNA-binding NarL/FixJ family response regulator